MSDRKMKIFIIVAFFTVFENSFEYLLSKFLYLNYVSIFNYHLHTGLAIVYISHETMSLLYFTQWVKIKSAIAKFCWFASKDISPSTSFLKSY